MIVQNHNNFNTTNIFQAGIIGGSTHFVVHYDGNIGIGTSTPKNKLNVVGDLNIQYYNSTGSALRVDANTVASPVTGLIVDKNGNVGIGVTAPGSKLELDGNLMFTAGTARIISLGVSSQGQTLTLRGATSSGNADGGQISITGGTGGPNGLNNGGPVVITGGSNNSSIQGGGGAVIIYGGDAIGGAPPASFGGSVYIYGGANDTPTAVGNVLLGINSSGTIRSNIAIATLSPVYKLDINGMTRITAGTSDTNILRVNRSNGESALIIMSDGNVGINTLAPTQTLDVNGTTRIIGDLNLSTTDTSSTNGISIDADLNRVCWGASCEVKADFNGDALIIG
ncbi:MAG TPA: hypothetical protein VJG83_03675 [archaeon]|nr:hypothetical protein [archaeon]